MSCYFVQSEIILKCSTLIFVGMCTHTYTYSTYIHNMKVENLLTNSFSVFVDKPLKLKLFETWIFLVFACLSIYGNI